MKKSTKITLIIAIVLMVVGGTVALVCLLLGGDLDGVGYYTNGWMDTEHYHSTTHENVEELLGDSKDVERWTFEGETIHSLDLDIEAGTLYFMEGDSYMVAVKNGRNGLRCQVKNGVLTLKETDSIYTLLDWGGKHTPTIVVVIPANVTLDDIHVTVGAGSVQAQSLQTGNLEIDVDAGSFLCSQSLVADRCEIDVDAGNVNISGGQIQSGLQADIDAGMITYQGSLSGDWQIDCDAGNVEMKLTGAVEDYNYQIEYDLGTVTVGTQEFSGMSDQISLRNGAQHQAQIQCNVGQVEVSFSK